MYISEKDDDHFMCLNSWGNYKREIYVERDEPTAKEFYVHFRKIVRAGYGGRPDKVM